MKNIDENMENNKINYYIQTKSLNIHHFYINGPIEDDIKVYADLLNVLKTSTEDDTIIIYINSEGGVLRMALQIANSMLSSQARIITSLDGEAYSAATLIFLAGHELIVNPNTTFMIHFYSGGAWGKGHELESRINYLGDHISKVMKSFYKKILTDQEMDDVISGRDIYMDSDELLRRLDLIGNENNEYDQLNINSSIQTNDPPKKESTKKKSTKKKTPKKKVSKK